MINNNIKKGDKVFWPELGTKCADTRITAFTPYTVEDFELGEIRILDDNKEDFYINCMVWFPYSPLLCELLQRYD